LISHLVRIAILNMTLQAIREGLLRHAWSDAQLAELENRLAGMDLLAGYNRAMRGERNMSVGTLDNCRRNKWRWDFKPFTYLGIIGHMDWPNIFAHFIPSGWFRQNELSIARFYQGVLAETDEKARRIYPDAAVAAEPNYIKMEHHPYHFLAAVVLPDTVAALIKTARTQTYVDAARVACALEHHRLANGELPKTLDALVPRFIDKIPNDAIDGQPLRYHPAADGNYIIYSIGWNKIDDGGERHWMNPEQKAGPDFRQGDWVWSSAAP